jgi:hypothetical protein
VSDVITIVSGLPRSGTSLLMQMLRAGGLPALTDNLRMPDESNPRGYLEFEPVKRLRNEKGWLEQARGKTVKIIHLLLRELPTDGTYNYRVILMKRPIKEVLASQRAMLDRQGKTSADDATLERIYLSQLTQIEAWLREQPVFSVLAIEHRRVLERPLEVAAEIKAFLRLDLNVEAMASAVDPNLYRQRL